MDSTKAGLTAVGKTIQDTLVRETLPSHHIRAARIRLLQYVTEGQRARLWARRRRLRLHSAAIGMVVALAIAWGSSWWLRSRPLSFEVGTRGSSGKIGDLVYASGQHELPILFSDGSSLVLADEARLRVLSADEAGARVLLESGEVAVVVAHPFGKNVRWTFEAGPLQVRVMGTEFVLAWNPASGVFSLNTRQGAVVVSGACLSAPQTVVAGAQLKVACPLAGPKPNSLVQSAPVPNPLSAPVRAGEVAATAEAPASHPIGGPLTGHAPSSAGVRADSTLAEPAWREALRAGRLSAALIAAEQANFEAVCVAARRDELLELADAARLSRKAKLAVSALLAIRRRFARSEDAATAAFALGRVAFEQRQDYAGAARWFQVYRDELPAGPFVGDAAGRLLEARALQGDRGGARAAAEGYLARFPQGPYAARARRVLAE